MSEFTKSLLSLESEATARNLSEIEEESGNIYRSIAVIGKRANQISVRMKEELISKLNEFASTTESLEEIFENREQIEISRFYEKLPHATLLAYNQFMDKEVYWREKEENPEESEKD